MSLDEGTPGGVPPISFGELMRRLSDPTTPEDEVLPYFVQVPARGSIDPAFQPNPALVTDLGVGLEGGAAVSLLNSWRRSQRHHAYRQRLAGGWSGPRIVSEGDSWFQYPTSLQDTIDHLMRDHAVLSLGGAGHTLRDMREQDEVIVNALREGARAVLVSAGGNDLFQDGNIANLIEPVFEGARPSDLLGPTFAAFLAQIMAEYRAFLLRLHRALPQVHILIHGYGPAHSRGGPWIGRPLTRRKVLPVAVQNALVLLILRRYNDALAEMAADPVFHGRLGHVDVTDIGRGFDDWHDEIHLDGENYALVADRFRKELARRLGAGLEMAVTPAEVAVELADPTAVAVADHARELLALDLPRLEAELELRLALIEHDPESADRAELPLMILARGGLESGTPGPGKLARRLLRRWERELHDLLCGGDAEDTAERKAILDKLSLGETAVIGAVTAWLATGPLALPAALAGVLAAILVKRLGGATHEVVCETWGERFEHAPPG